MQVMVTPLKRVSISAASETMPALNKIPIKPPERRPSPAPISPNTTKNQTKRDRPYTAAVSPSTGSLSKPCCKNSAARGILNKNVARGAGNLGIADMDDILGKVSPSNECCG